MNELVFDYLFSTYSISGLDRESLYYSDTSIKYSGYSQESFVAHANRVGHTILSSQLTNALNQFESIYRNDDLCYEYTKYDSLLQALLPTLDSSFDKITFVSAVSVAKRSLQYWDTSYVKWDSLAYDLAGPSAHRNILNRQKTHAGKDMAYADCMGAITGAIGGAIIGAGGGTVVIPIVGTAVGGACGVLVGCIGGAITGSAVSAVHSVIQWLINW